MGVTPHQGDGKADHRAKQDRQDKSLMKLSEVRRNAAVRSSKVFRDSSKKKPIQRLIVVVIKDRIQTIYINRTELIKRLLAEVCELCNTKNVALEGHHIRKLKDLKAYWNGKDKPQWVEKIIKIRRKTLFVCKNCHQKIHSVQYDGRNLTQVLLESPVL